MHRLDQSTHNMGRSSVLEGGFPARVPSCFSNFRNIFLRSPFRSTATLGTSLTCDPATIPEHENSGLEASKQRELMRISSTRRLSSSSYSSSSSSKSFFSATKPATNILRISTAEANRQPVPTPEASCSKHIRTAIPDPVFALFAFLARQGVHVTDLFRRPGNITQMKTISSQLAVGEPVDWSIYNIYTVANVAKRFLLSVPGGLLGDQNERKLLATAVSYCLPCHEQRQEEEVVEEPPKQTHLRPHHHQHLHHPHLTHYHHLRASAGVSEGSLSVPSKLMHAPGFRPLEPVTGSKSLCISPSFTDRSGFLTDFGLGPPLPFERTQMDSFVGILESLPKASRELVVLIFGILHSMVRHASALFITGCPSCSSSLDLHSNSLGDLGGRDAVTGSPTSGVSTPTVRTLAEAVSKSIVGALIHTCPLSVDMVDRASQVLQTLLLRYSLLGDSATSFYTDFMLGRVRPKSAPDVQSVPMANVISQFIIPRVPAHKVRSRKKGSITKVAAFASVASRLAHLTDSFGGGGGNARRHWWRIGSGGTTVPDSSKTIPNNSSFSSSVSPAFSLQQTLVQPSNIPIKPYETPSTPFVLTEPAPPLPQRLQMPVTASVETPDQITDPPASHAEDVCNAGETEVEALHRPVLARSSSRCSYSRYRAVHRRQLDAMLRRTAWFLDPNTSRQSVSSGPTGGCNDRLGTNPRVFISHEPTSIDVCCCRPSETTHSVALPPLISITQTSTVSLLDFGRDRDEGSCGPGSYREFAASASDLEAPTSAWAGPGFQNSPDILTFTGQHLYLGTNAHSISMATVRSAPTRHASPAASSDYRLCPDPDHCTRPILAMTSQRASFPEKSQNPT
uniref:RhoGAP domain n=1 Tax=Schistocephalus solidus TaxID=70667 RepID=A0A0X3PZM6_SCHSO